MYRLLSIILLLAVFDSILAQSPHGEQFIVNCGDCHTAESWEIPSRHWESASFSHDQTDFPLTGGHTSTDCRFCHETLVFTEARTSCVSCHEDLHRMTVGSDCARCHSTENWLVDNITELHQENGFPLLGVHAQISCDECHASESGLQFPRIGNECINCHREDFMATTSPNHASAGYSTDCLECHDLAAFGWAANGIIHDFFPLEKGHDISDCNQCHVNGNFSNTPTECVDCHQDDFNNATNPNHRNLNLSTDCATCHTIDPDWMPADYRQHDNDFFPIYSGKHQGEWSDCVECHENPGNYAEFTCISCHENPETDEKHQDVGGYIYSSTACLACHPNGDTDGVFDHNRTDFPLTGAHQQVDCKDCHTNGFQGTPTDCEACHLPDYQQAMNPNHQQLGFPMDCASCHTTDPDWTPVNFDHDTYHVLKDAHKLIENNCAACHNSTFTNTPNTCAGCHIADYNQATSPNHLSAGFPTDCESCHTEDSWAPANFDHNTFYELKGAHALIANNCAECHNSTFTNTPTTCIGCHTADYNQTTNPNHLSTGFPTDCESCHTEDNWVPSTFDHDALFPIYRGKHKDEWNQCIDCHTIAGNLMSFSCIDCHEHSDKNDVDNDHQGVSNYRYVSTDCFACHPKGD